MTEIISVLLEIGKIALKIFTLSWWALVPLALFFIFLDWWIFRKSFFYLFNLKWILLEVKVPKEVSKTPKAMENIFAAVHAIYTGEPDWEDIFFRGECLDWLSFEMVGYGGGVHFYIRVQEHQRNLIESAIYAEYPDAEITTVEDYTKLMPQVLPNEVYDLWGNDFVLSKENSYPIKTYDFFEAPVEEKRLDPISAITEAMSRLKEGEMIWLQILIKPIGEKWKKEGEELRDKLMQRKKEEKLGFFGEIFEGIAHFLKNLLVAVAIFPSWPEKGKKEERDKRLYLSPGETDILKGIENKISKLGFESLIRFIYIDRRDSFTRSNVAAVLGAFKQFNTLNMNAFKIDSDTRTYVTKRKFTLKGLFKKSKLYLRKRLISDLYKFRLFSFGAKKLPILNTEELATVFHFPLTTVEAPKLARLGTRRGEPPAGLPME